MMDRAIGIRRCGLDPVSSIEEVGLVDGKVVALKLNQQQLELVDRTVATGVSPDRAALIRLALREQAAKQAASVPKADLR